MVRLRMPSDAQRMMCTSGLQPPVLPSLLNLSLPSSGSVADDQVHQLTVDSFSTCT